MRPDKNHDERTAAFRLNGSLASKGYMTCINCGAKVEKHTAFCPLCGMRVKRPSAVFPKPFSSEARGPEQLDGQSPVVFEVMETPVLKPRQRKNEPQNGDSPFGGMDSSDSDTGPFGKSDMDISYTGAIKGARIKRNGRGGRRSPQRLRPYNESPAENGDSPNKNELVLYDDDDDTGDSEMDDEIIPGKGNSKASKGRAGRRSPQQAPIPILIAIGALLSATCILAAIFFIRSDKYETALKHFEDGSYSEAESGFSMLGNYKDASNYMEYLHSLTLFGNEKFDEAIEGFDKLDDFIDSKMRMAECENEKKYSKALELEKSGSLSESYAIFSTLGAYKDSELRASGCVSPRPQTGLIGKVNGSENGSEKLLMENGNEDAFFVLAEPEGKKVAKGFVRKGESLSLNVPRGEYSFKAAYGSVWFGIENLFGNDGVYTIIQDKSSDEFSISKETKLTLGPEKGKKIEFKEF